MEVSKSGLPVEYRVYGLRRTGVDGTGKVITAGVHAERMTKAEAMKFAMNVYLQYGDAVSCVVVAMTKDQHGSRKVVHRIGGGKSWWE